MEMTCLSDTYTTAFPTNEDSSTLLGERTIEHSLRRAAERRHSKAKTKPRSWNAFCYNIVTYLLLITSILLILCAILLFIYPLTDVFNNLRMHMHRSLPPFKSWAHPLPIVYCRAHIFNMENAESFLNGTDEKLRVKEVGPVVFREVLEHNDIVFHENSTLSYTVRRYLQFLPEMNEPGILNRTVVVPNFMFLGMATQVPDFFKMGFNLVTKNDDVFVKRTVYEYFWNFTTPAMLTVDKYLPFLLPQNNGGTLHSIYMDFNDRVNVRIGPRYSAHEFFSINTYRYRPTVPGFRPERGECYADLKNSSEGAMYPSRVSKDMILYYWRKTVCRPVPLYFQKEEMVGSLLGYKFVTHDDWYDRTENLTADCYKGFTKTPLADGLSDVSKCYKNFPIAVSSPHFSGRSGYWTDKVEGYVPDPEGHRSYTIVEPLNGVPLSQVARSQSNIVLPKLTRFRPDVNKVGEMVLPLIWLEYHQPRLTPDITSLLIFSTKVLPRIEYLVPVIFLLLGIFMMLLVIRRRLSRDFSLGGYSRIKLLWQRKKETFFGRQ